MLHSANPHYSVSCHSCRVSPHLLTTGLVYLSPLLDTSHGVSRSHCSWWIPCCLRTRELLEAMGFHVPLASRICAGTLTVYLNLHDKRLAADRHSFRNTNWYTRPHRPPTGRCVMRRFGYDMIHPRCTIPLDSAGSPLTILNLTPYPLRINSTLRFSTMTFVTTTSDITWVAPTCGSDDHAVESTRRRVLNAATMVPRCSAHNDASLCEATRTSTGDIASVGVRNTSLRRRNQGRNRPVRSAKGRCVSCSPLISLRII